MCWQWQSRFWGEFLPERLHLRRYFNVTKSLYSFNIWQFRLFLCSVYHHLCILLEWLYWMYLIIIIWKKCNDTVLRAFWVVNHIKLRFHVTPANIPTWTHNFWNRVERAIYFGVYPSWIPTFPTDKHNSTFNKCLSRWQYLQNIYAYFSYNPTCVWNKMLLWFWWFALLRYDGGPFRQEFSTLGLGVCFICSCAQCIPEVIIFCAGFAHTVLLRLGILDE